MTNKFSLSPLLGIDRDRRALLVGLTAARADIYVIEFDAWRP